MLNEINKNNLHHAYLIEGLADKILPEICKLADSLKIKTSGNPDFCRIILDSFKIEDARNLKFWALEKSLSENKKFYIIVANNFLIEAQNALLKMFEEPIENTHFFLIAPDVDIFLPTLLSRFYLIRSEINLPNELKEAERFISLPLPSRINFLREMLAEEDKVSEAPDTPDTHLDSPRAKALKFLNALERILHDKPMSRTVLDIGYFEQIFKVRRYLRQPGSSAKTLLESVALIVPNIK
jgi:hypothetical protein